MIPEQDAPSSPGCVARLLAGLVAFSARFPRSLLALACLACAASVVAFCTQLEFHTQRSDLISPDKEYQRRWQQYQAEFGVDDDIVAVVQGNDPQRLQQAVEALGAAIARRPDLFDRLFYKVDLRHLRDRALLYLSTDDIRIILDNLRSMRLLLEFGPISWQALTLDGLLHEARARAGRLPYGRQVGPADDQFFTQLLNVCQSASATLARPESYSNPWHSLLPSASEQHDLLAEPQYFFSTDRTLAFLLVRPIQDNATFTPAQRNVAVLRSMVDQVRQDFPDLEFGLTGLPVLETDEMVASQADTNLASWLALGGVTLLYLVVFRGLRYPLATVVTLLCGTAWAMGWLTLTVGHLNILSATFVMMLIGLGDYGVLWVTRFEQDRVAGCDVATALQNTAISVGPGILTAACTTSLAFFTAMLADFRAVAELGWIAGSGVLLCALACFTVLPAWLQLTDRRGRLLAERCVLPFSPTAQQASLTAWLPGLVRRPRLVIGTTAILVTVLGAFACRLRYDHNLLRLQAHGLESVSWELKLIERMAGASWHALSYRVDPQEVFDLKRRFEQLPGVGRVVEIASLVPADQETKLTQLRDLQYLLRRLPPRGAHLPHALPNLATIRAELTCLVSQLQPLADASPQPLLNDLRRALLTLQDQLSKLPAATAAERLRSFEERLAEDLAEDLHRLRAVAQPHPITLNDLPLALRERYVSPRGYWLLRVFGRDCLWEYEPLANFCRHIQQVDPLATGKPFTTLEGLRVMKEGFLRAGLYALLAILVVLAVDFRKPRQVLLALTPLAIGVTLTLGLMGLLGWPLNPANMIAFPLVLGVGVDNGVHVLHDYLSRRQAGESYRLSRATGRGILVAALTTILGFGTLLVSRHQGLVGLGLILTLGVTCCMLAALVLLPAVLRLISLRQVCPRLHLKDRRAAA